MIEFDKCFKNQNFYHIQYFLTLCSNYGQVEQIITTYIERNLSVIDGEANSDKDLDLLFGGQSNGFLGVNFNSQDITPIRQIINQFSYDAFKEKERENYDSSTFWEKKNIIFSNLEFCENTKSQIENKGKSKEFDQIMDRLNALNIYASLWKESNNEFNVKDCNRNSNLKISHESESTLNNQNLLRQRYFTTPDGDSKLFEIHIKTGNLRIHIYPDEENRILYIGHIGPHLKF